MTVPFDCREDGSDCVFMGKVALPVEPRTLTALVYLTAELLRRGREVALFCEQPFTHQFEARGPVRDSILSGAGKLERAGETIMAAEQMFGNHADELDIIHSQPWDPTGSRYSSPTLTRRHDRLDLPEYGPLCKQFRNVSFISASDAQRRSLAWASWRRPSIYPGVLSKLYRFIPRPGNTWPLSAPFPSKKDWLWRLNWSGGCSSRSASLPGKAESPGFLSRVRPS